MKMTQISVHFTNSKAECVTGGHLLQTHRRQIRSQWRAPLCRTCLLCV